MDRNNKYYGLIENLVKQHRKFPGYEAIIEDIIDDVYSHSEVIISSIDNESVIESYLQKVISTSIITVPKRLKFPSPESRKVVSATPELNIPSYAEDIKIPEPQAPEPIVEEKPVLEETAADISTVEEDIVLEEEPEQNDEVIKELANQPSNDIMTFTENIVSEKANPKFVDQMINTMNADLVSEHENEFSVVLDADVDTDLDIANDDIEVVEEEEVSLPEEDSLEQDSIIEEEEFSLPEEDSVEQETIIEEEDTDSIDAIVEEENLDNTNEVEQITELEEAANDDLMLNDDLEILTDAEEDSSFEEELSAETDVIEETVEDTLLPEESVASEEEVITAIDEDDTDSVVQLDIQEEASDILEENDLSTDNEELSFSDDSSNDFIEEDTSINLVSNEVETLEENADTEQETIIDDSSELADFGSSDELQEETISLETDELISMGDGADELSLVETDDIQSDELPEISNDELSEDVITLENSDNISVGTDEEEFEQNDEYEEDFLEPQFEKKADTIEYRAVDYAKFDYNPNDVQTVVDANQISSKLLQLDSSKPNLKVLDIFDLRFKKNYTLEQISVELNMIKEDVVSVLNEIVELV